MRQERETVGAAVLKTKTDSETFQETVNKSIGGLEVRLHDILHSIKVDRKAFHGDIFVGNDCKKIIAQNVYVCSVIKGDEMHSKIVQLFRVFGEIQQILFTKQFLSEAEISWVQAKCWEFGTLFPKCFPNEYYTQNLRVSF